MGTYEEWEEEQIELGNLRYSKSNNSRGRLVGKWKKKYIIKKSNAKIKDRVFTLTFKEYLYKAYEARLTDPDQISTIGDSNKTYNLARYKDLGGYTIDNCKFITHKENRRERDEHFNVNRHLKHINKERVKNGTHHLLNVPPWKSNKVTKGSLEVWSKADSIYNWWVNNKVGCIKLQNHFRFTSQKACRSVIKKFKEDWNPLEDEQWLEFKHNNKASI